MRQLTYALLVKIITCRLHPLSSKEPYRTVFSGNSCWNSDMNKGNSFEVTPCLPRRTFVDRVAESLPWQQGSWGQYRARLGPTGPRWAACWPHETCYLGKVHDSKSIKTMIGLWQVVTGQRHTGELWVLCHELTTRPRFCRLLSMWKPIYCFEKYWFIMNPNMQNV